MLARRTTRAGGYWLSNLSNPPANQLAVWCINLGPLQSPFPLSTVLPGIGAACTGQISLAGVITLAAITSGSGSYTFYLGLPNDRHLNDVILSSQVACLTSLTGTCRGVDGAAGLRRRQRSTRR